MKKFFVIVTSTLLLQNIHAQNKDAEAIQKAMNDQIAAWNSGNIDAFMETYWSNDSLLFVGKDGPAYGWKTTLERYKKNYPDTALMGKLGLNILQTKELSPEYYFVLGKWHLKRTVGDVEGYFTLLFRKINGKWVIVADHTS